MTEILITGGIGDFIALESYFSDELREQLTTIHFATPAQQSITTILDALPNYPNLQSAVIEWEDWTNISSFLNKWEVLTMLSRTYDEYPTLENVEDWSLCEKSRQILKGKICYNYSSAIAHQLTKPPYIPQPYTVIHPYTSERQERKFTSQDWDYIADNVNGTLIILGTEQTEVPKKCINLIGKTTLLESIEITKNAHYFIGIDSCLSVIAAKVLPKDKLIIKSKNKIGLEQWACIYYHPRTSFSFIHEDLGIPTQWKFRHTPMYLGNFKMLKDS